MPHYKIPLPGAKFPAQENDTFDNPGSLAGLAARLQWLQAQAQDKALHQNAILVTDWTTTGEFYNWLLNYEAGRIEGPTGLMGDPNAPPPTPPPAFMAVAVLNEDGGIGFATEQVSIEHGGSPVCEVPEYTRIPAPQH